MPKNRQHPNLNAMVLRHAKTEKICSIDLKCVEKTGTKVGYGDACTVDTDCSDGLKCHKKQNKCRFAEEADVKDDDCTVEGSFCSGNVLVNCQTMSIDQDDDTLYATTVTCATSGNVCTKSGTVSACMMPCEKIGASYKVCSGDDDMNLTTFTCTEVNGVKVFVPSETECPAWAVVCLSQRITLRDARNSGIWS